MEAITRAVAELDLDAIKANGDASLAALMKLYKNPYGDLPLNQFEESLGEIPALVAEVERLRAAVALHQPHEYGADDLAWMGCRECGQDWPCPTARAAGVEGPARRSTPMKAAGAPTPIPSLPGSA